MGSQTKKKQIWWEHKKDKFIDQHYQLEISGDSNILRIKYGSHSTRVVVENQDFSSMTEESIVFNINLNALISHIARDYYTQHVSINYVHFYISLCLGYGIYLKVTYYLLFANK